jgi:hypothetical protein
MGRGPISCLISSPPVGFHLTAQGNLMETPSLMRKDNSSRPTHHRQLYKMRYRFSPLSCAGILTCSPFAACALIGAKCKLLGSHLGLANSRTITVRVKTFSTSMQGKCIQNCSGTDLYHKSLTIPSMKVTIRSPITYTARIYDNFAQFVNQQSGQIDSAAWNALPKKGDSAVVVLKILPFSKDGQALGTGAYILKLSVQALGDQVTKSASGESIIVKNAHRQYVSRFGYLRAH